MSKKLFTICLLLFLLSIEVHAEENLSAVIDGIQKKYEQINNFQALFTQESEVKSLNKTQLAEGEVWFKNPGKMRWNYNSPNKDQLVTDGNTQWFYDESEEQVIEPPLAPVTESQPSTTIL